MEKIEKKLKEVIDGWNSCLALMVELDAMELEVLRKRILEKFELREK